MYKYITLAMVLSASYASLDSADIDNIPISISPQCSVKVTMDNLTMTGFETDDSAYANILVEVDTTGDILMTTELDLANSFLGADAAATTGDALNLEPILWSLKASTVDVKEGDSESYDRDDAAAGIFIQKGDGVAADKVNNSNSGQASYHDHSVRMLHGAELTTPLRNISNANDVETNANKLQALDLANLLITSSGDATDASTGVIVDATDKWKTAVSNLQAKELLTENCKIDFNYKFGYHFPMGATGTDASEIINLKVKTTIIDQ